MSLYFFKFKNLITTSGILCSIYNFDCEFKKKFFETTLNSNEQKLSTINILHTNFLTR